MASLGWMHWIEKACGEVLRSALLNVREGVLTSVGVAAPLTEA